VSIKPFEVTTVYPDGRSETRMATSEEVAQREADIEEAARLKAEEEAWLAEQSTKRQSALDKLTALGLTEDEAKALFGG
jgi:hypothetical protein